MTWAITGLTVALMLYLVEQRKVSAVGMLCGAVLGALPLLVGMGSANATASMWLSAVGLIAVYVLNTQLPSEDQARYLILVPILLWVIGMLDYIQYRVNNIMPLNWQTLLYHIAILVFAGHAALRFLGIFHESDETQKLGVALAGLVVISALILTGTLGWGLIYQ
jgi:hypothetical protein